MNYSSCRLAGALALVPLALPITVSAAGFQLFEQNVSGLGNAYAGAAAAAEDASTIFFNPAGLTRLDGTSFVAGANYIVPSIKFNDQGSRPAAGRALGGNGGDAGDGAIVPNFYIAHRLNPSWSLGLGVGAPFGLKTEYDPTWAGRFIAVKSELTTYQINPSIAFKLNDAWSFGAGVSFLRARAELTNKVNLGPFGEGTAKVTGADNGWAYNLGVMWQPSAATRVGLAYRSSSSITLEGDVSTTPDSPVPAPVQAALPNGGARATTRLPDTASIALVQRLAPRWDLLADVTWTHWAVFHQLQVQRDTGATLSTVPENWRNTYRFAVGVNYQLADSWKLRTGVAYDQSAVRDADRTPRIPDSDRYWLSFGVQYQFAKSGAVDVGYTHIFAKSASINDVQRDAAGNPAAGTSNLVGTYKSSVNILGVQARYAF